MIVMRLRLMRRQPCLAMDGLGVQWRRHQQEMAKQDQQETGLADEWNTARAANDEHGHLLGNQAVHPPGGTVYTGASNAS
jgi:hypothetical protein